MKTPGLYHPVRIKEVIRETANFSTIIFEDEPSIVYKAGQYLTLVKDPETANELRRSYSLVSAPLLQEPLAIGVKRVDNGSFSRVLVDQSKPGDELVTTGTGGFFVLPEDIQRYQQLFFFAAGSGITPVYAMLKTALHFFPHLSVVLVYSNSSPEQAVYLSGLQALQQQFESRFSFLPLFSNSPDLFRARLHRDLILQYLNQYVSKQPSTLFFTCGPEAYMRLCIYILQAWGIDPANIRKENFYTKDGVKALPAPPDKESHLVMISRQGSQFAFTVQYPDTILQAARKAGISLPYSCEAGQCGNCVARCLRGTVWHAYNDVLTDRQLAQGWVLTCVGHPVGGNVELAV